MEIYFLHLEREESQRVLPVPAAFPVVLIINNQYTIVGYLGAACPGPQQRLYEN